MWRSRAQRPRRIRYHNNNTKAALKQDPNRQKTSFSEKKGADIGQVRQKQEIDFTKKSRVQIVKKVPSSRHVRMDGTQPGKLSTESVRGPLGRVRGSALNFVQKGLRSRGASCGRSSRGGAGAAVQICKRAATRAANLDNGNQIRGEGFLTCAAGRKGSPLE